MTNDKKNLLLFNIQDYLGLLVITEFRPHAFISGLIDSDDEAVRTQYTIDTIYRLLVCGLVEPGHLRGSSYKKNQAEIDAHLQVLMKHNPFSSDVNVFIHWFVWEIFSTPLNDALVAKHRIQEDYERTLNPAFGLALTDLFEAHGVGLAIYPLVLPQAS